MRRLLTAVVVGLGALASGCSTKPDPIVKLEMVRPSVPASAATPCPRPVALPDRDLTERETASAWGRDRSSLEICEERRAAAVRAAEGQQ